MKRILRSIALAITLFALLPLETRAAELLIPVGRIIGVQLSSNSITVAAYDDVFGKNARAAGLKIGDVIVSLNGSEVKDVEDIRSILKECNESVSLTVRRGSKLATVELTPAETDNGPKLGVYLRQGIAGIGTVTFFNPDTGLFGTLGHGVNDSRGQLLSMTQGYAYAATVQSVKKGKSGDPGQLKGEASSQQVCGTLLRNTPQGVFGTTTTGWKGEPIPTAEYSEIHPGCATIRSTVCGNTPQDYSVELLKIYPESRSDGRNFLIKVTDPGLLKATGGIVQGMSGSPIIQDGHLVGAVTHVLVNDSTTGYGIYIGNMLSAAA